MAAEQGLRRGSEGGRGGVALNPEWPRGCGGSARWKGSGLAEEEEQESEG